MTLKGFPHSEIPGSKLVCSSPGLIAAYRVLHRLLAPRHSPYALSSLTTSVWTHADRLSACASKSVRMRPLFSHCVLSGSGPRTLRDKSRNAAQAFCQTTCSKRTTVCRIFSCQRTRAVALARSSVTRRDRSQRSSNMVENTGLEPVTSWLQTRRSPS